MSKWLKTIETERKVDEIAQNCFILITEDNHLLIEVDLDQITGLTKEKAYRIASAPGIHLRHLTAEGSTLLPHHRLTITVYRERWCVNCLMKMGPDQWSSHGDGSFEIHDECWKQWIRRHPEYAEYEPPEDPVYEEEGSE